MIGTISFILQKLRPDGESQSEPVFTDGRDGWITSRLLSCLPEGTGAFLVGGEEGVLQSYRTIPYRKKGGLLKVKGITFVFSREGNTWRK